MTENFDGLPDHPKFHSTTKQDEDNNSTNFQVKKFTKETNIQREELKSIQKSIAIQQQTLYKILNVLMSFEQLQNYY